MQDMRQGSTAMAAKRIHKAVSLLLPPCTKGFLRGLCEADNSHSCSHLSSSAGLALRVWHWPTCKALAEELLVAVVKAAVKLTVACSVGLCSSLQMKNCLLRLDIPLD